MTDFAATLNAVRSLLSPFGALRARPAVDWTGEELLYPDLVRFYAIVSPWGDDGAAVPSGLWIPSYNNDY